MQTFGAVVILALGFGAVGLLKSWIIRILDRRYPFRGWDRMS